MNKRNDKKEPLCMTSEKGEVFFSEDEISQNKADIGMRIIEAFGYQPELEIAFLLKTNSITVNSFIEGEEFPPTEMLLSIHRATGVSIHWLLTGEGTKHPSFNEHRIGSDEMAVLGLA
jgi:hypothetical protein